MKHAVVACCAAMLMAAGCNAIFGVGDLRIDEPTGAGGMTGSGGSGDGGEGTGAGPSCAEGQEQPCYEGPDGTEGVGPCQAGTQRCEGGRWGPCTDQVLPQPVDCDNPEDIDCNGYACGELLWSKSYGSTGEEYSTALTVTSSGQVVVGGMFGDTISFGVDTYTPSNLRDGFLLTLDPSGQEVDSMQVATNGVGVVSSVEEMPDGGLFICGSFGGQLTLPGVPIMLSGGGPLDSFVARLSPTGQIMWADHISGGGSQYCNNVVVAGGSVMAWGSFSEEIEIGAMAANAVGGADAFLASWTDAGQLQWITPMGSAGNERGRGITFVGDGVVVSGLYGGDFDIDGVSFTHAGAQITTDAMLLKVNMMGEVVWGLAFSGLSFDRAFDVAAAGNGDVVATGYFEQDLTVGNETLISQNGEDIWVARVAADGSVQWAQSFGGPDDQRAMHIAIGPSGDLYIAGWFVGDLDLGGDLLIEQDNTPDIFLARLAPDGSHRFSRAFAMTGTPTSSHFLNENIRRLAIDPQGFVLLSALYDGDLDVDGTIYSSEGIADIFVAKFAP